jgi:hypothetical protein
VLLSPGSGRGATPARRGAPLGCCAGRGRFQASMLTVRTQSCLIQRKGLRPPSRSPGRGTPIVPSRLMVLSSEIHILFNTATPRPTSFAAAAAVGISARKPAPGDCSCYRHLLRSDQHQHQIKTACSRAARNSQPRKTQAPVHTNKHPRHFMRMHRKPHPYTPRNQRGGDLCVLPLSLPQRRPHQLIFLRRRIRSKFR